MMKAIVDKGAGAGRANCGSEAKLSRRGFVKKTGAPVAGVAGMCAMDLKDARAQEAEPGRKSFTVHSIDAFDNTPVIDLKS